jgi:hypothetical protein
MADQTEKARGSLEEALMQELRFGGIDRGQLKELVAIAARIRMNGVRGIRVFPKGIPVIDGLRVSGIVDASDASKILGEILHGGWIHAVEVFPYGIPRPEVFGLNVDLGPSRVGSTPMPG